MSDRLRVALVCPGRGSYGRDQLGTLPLDDERVAWLDAYRKGLDRPSLAELDGKERFSARWHLAGEHASLLTFAATVADLAALDPAKAEVVAVTGNSMGFYTALHASGCLALDEAAHLVETLASFQAGNVVGGQLLYPLVDGSWTTQDELVGTLERALEHPELHLSIRLGGTAVLGGTDAGLKHAQQVLPPIERTGRTFPQKLPLHSAFHTPVMTPTSERAFDALGGMELGRPRVPLVDGEGRVWRHWSDPRELLAWTLGHQIVATYDFTAAVTTVLGDYAPDALVCPGPGDTMGGPVGQVLVQLGWRGLRDFQDFLEAQRSDRPLVLAMVRPEQRARVV